jgi:hypothetical protein
MLPTTSRRLAADIERYENRAAARIARTPSKIAKASKMKPTAKFHTANILSATTGILFNDNSEDNGFHGLALLANHLSGESLDTLEIRYMDFSALLKQSPWAKATPADVRSHSGGWQGFLAAMIAAHGEWHEVESDVQS